MKHYSQLSLKVLKLMIEREIISIEKTHDVWAESIMFSQGEEYQQGDGHWCETIYATVVVGPDTFDYELEWDIDDEKITTVTKGEKI